MRYLFFLSIILITGCSGSPTEPEPATRFYPAFKVCIPDDRREMAARWVTDTVRAATPQTNNQAPEDWIEETGRQALILFGEPVLGAWVGGGTYTNEFVPYEELSPAQRVLCDAFMQRQPREKP